MARWTPERRAATGAARKAWIAKPENAAKIRRNHLRERAEASMTKAERDAEYLRLRREVGLDG